MNTQEVPPINNETLERGSSVEQPKTKAVEMVDTDSTETEQEAIAEIKNDILKNHIAVDISNPSQENQTQYTPSTKPRSGIKKVTAFLGGLLGLTSAAATEVKSAETIFSDSSNQKKEVLNPVKDTLAAKESTVNFSEFATKKQKTIEFIPDGQEIAGVTIEGYVTVPSSDESKDVFFVKLSGNENDPDVFRKMYNTLKKAGYTIEGKDMLDDVSARGGTLLKKKVPWGVALGETAAEAEHVFDQKNGKVNAIYYTINPQGSGSVEISAAQAVDIAYDYAVLVSKPAEKPNSEKGILAKN